MAVREGQMDIDGVEIVRAWIRSVIVLAIALLIFCSMMLVDETFKVLPDKGPWSWWPLVLLISLIFLLMGVVEAIRIRRERARVDRLRKEADRGGEEALKGAAKKGI